jgi:hypothetical protein
MLVSFVCGVAKRHDSHQPYSTGNLYCHMKAEHVLPSEELNNADEIGSSDEDNEDDGSDDDSIVSSTDENPVDWSPDAHNILTSPGSADSPAGDRRALIHNKSMMGCTVSSLPAKAILPSGRSFVDVDVLHSNSNEGIWPR